MLVAGMLLWLSASIMAQDEQPPTDAASGVTIHVVQRGETLFRIAQEYGYSVEAIAELNGLSDPSSLQVGQRLLIPTSSDQSSRQAQEHIVQPGETLASIANLYGTSVEQLAATNNINNINALYVGQVLTIIPEQIIATNIEPPEPMMPGRVIHTVQSGETLFRIGQLYGLTVNEIVQANGLSDTNIYVGQQLVLPGVTPPQLALDLPAAITGLDVTPLILVEGQAARIRLSTAESATVYGNFLSKELSFISDGDRQRHLSLFGVPLSTEAGIYPVNITVLTDAGEETTINFNVQIVSGGYGVTNIELPAGSDLALLDTSTDEQELAMLGSVSSQITPEKYLTAPMGLPAAAPMNAVFGTRRSYNGGEANRFHLGADFAGGPGSPILAAGPGRVVLVDWLSLRGLATIIDHGWGVYTIYAHQKDVMVNVGDFVQAGQQIGVVGSSGRVTGPHLHWEVWIQGTPVDPMQFVQQDFP